MAPRRTPVPCSRRRPHSEAVHEQSGRADNLPVRSFRYIHVLLRASRSIRRRVARRSRPFAEATSSGTLAAPAMRQLTRRICTLPSSASRRSASGGRANRSTVPNFRRKIAGPGATQDCLFRQRPRILDPPRTKNIEDRGPEPRSRAQSREPRVESPGREPRAPGGTKIMVKARLLPV